MCQSLIDELSASHSTDLQQRAYEFQAVLGLDAHAVESIMPSDASCEDIEVDKNLSFLNNYVQRSLEKGARPYIPGSERSGMVNINNFRNHDQLEASTHALRFEAYELPKPSMPTKPTPIPSAYSTDLVTVSDSTYPKETHQAAPLSSTPASAAIDLGAKLRLDGVQKKWGRSTYSSPAPSTSTSSTQKTVNGTTLVDAPVASGARDASYNQRRQQPEVSAEKQRLAASLFGGVLSKNEKRPSLGHKASRGSSPAMTEKTHTASSVVPSAEVAAEKAAPPPQPPSDLLDLGDPIPGTTPCVDPFTQLEGLVGPSQLSSSSSSGTVGVSKPSDLMAELYGDAPSTGLSGSVANPLLNDAYPGNEKSGLPSSTNNNVVKNPALVKKGPNLQDSLEKDALARQVGVTPTVQNPNLFKDLLG